jgi:DNA repair exonuclease SbcCD ATPase subunit
MPENLRAFAAAALSFALAAFIAGTAMAQSKGKIVCWKDKAGKVVGCGDRVPPEYEDSATKELDARGVTRKTTESAADEAKRVAEDAKQAKQKEGVTRQREEEKRLVTVQRREDAALLATFSNEQEIDRKRDRDLEEVSRQIAQLQAAQHNAAERALDLKGRIEAGEKAKKPVSDHFKDEAARAENDRVRFEKGIVAKTKEKEEVGKRYADMKQRYNELMGTRAPAPTAAAPAKK